MIVAKRKPFEEIKDLLKDYNKVLTVGCGTCVAVCLAGGEKEVDVLNAELEMTRKLDDNPIELGAKTVERQCDREYLAELDDMAKEYDAILSMACEQIEEFKEMKGVDGVHLMAIEWEHKVPEIAERAKVLPRPQID